MPLCVSSSHFSFKATREHESLWHKSLAFTPARQPQTAIAAKAAAGLVALNRESFRRERPLD